MKLQRKFDETENIINDILIKRVKGGNIDYSSRRTDVQSDIETPGDTIDAGSAVLEDLKEILAEFKKVFLNDEGKYVKISVWKWIFVKKYRTKVNNFVEFCLDKFKVIAGRFK